MKKTKKFLGNIPFDYFGNPSDHDAAHQSIYLTKDNFQHGLLHLPTFDETKKQWVMKPIDNPPADFEINYLDQPLPYRRDVIATIPRFLYIPNFEFDDKIKYIACHKSRYSVSFSFQSLINQRTYSMFASRFDDAVAFMDKGIIEGRFTFCKRGPSYSLEIA